jgi:hypothetical protein
MTMYRQISRSFSLGVAALVGVTSVAAAQWNQNGPRNGRELFEWRGSVDREVQIFMRGDRVWTRNVGRTEPNNDRSRTLSTLPRQQGDVVVRLVDGRGDVDVIQQPSARNDYTTIVRIRDQRSGSDGYRLAAYWQGSAGGDVYRRSDDWGRGRGDEMRRRDRDDDGDWDRGRGNDRRQSVLRWTGNVDNELEIRLQNGRIEYRTLSGNQPTGIRVNAGNVSAARGNALGVAANQGRGTVAVVQQPNLMNGYTTVIRVRDPQGGYGHYDFDLVTR